MRIQFPLQLAILFFVISYQANAQKKLVIIGSSTSACMGATVVDSCYVGRLRAYYNKVAPLDTLINNDYSVGGYAVYRGMPSSYVPPYTNPALQPDTLHNITAALAIHPDVVLVNYPTNGYDTLPVSNIMFCLRTIRDVANQAGVPCFITTTQPRTIAPFNTSAVKRRLADLKDSILLAFGPFAIDFYTDLINPADSSIRYDYGDATHMNNTGHDSLYRRVQRKNVFAASLANGLQAAYYNNTNLTGTPVITRIDPTVNFDFVYQQAAPGVNLENYSVRWSGQVKAVYNETYTFYTTADDGVRLWVNGVQLVNNWINQSATEKSGTITLAAGQKYDIVMEYYQGTGYAVAKLAWSSPSTPKAIIPALQLSPGAATLPPASGGTGLQAAYYNNITLAGTPVITRIDPTIDYNFVYQQAAPGVNLENYSVRWSGQVQAVYNETYTFYATTDDGVRLWVNGVQLVNNWVNQSATEKSGSITLAAGQKYDIVMEYYQGTGYAVAKLAWSSASTSKTVIPQSQLFPPDVNNGTGLQAVYFNNITLAGTPVITRVEPGINYDFVYQQAAPGVNLENYSVRWSGQVKAVYAETYTFYATTDDGVRLWVNGVQLVNNWVNQSATEKSASISLAAGQKYDIVMEYYQGTGYAVAKLAWSSASTPKTIIPQSQLFPPVGAALVAQAEQTFKTSAGANLASLTATVSANPVMAGQSARLQINSSRATSVLVSLINSNGVIIHAEKLNLVAGTNISVVNTFLLSRGLYLINIQNAGRAITKKLVLQ